MPVQVDSDTNKVLIGDDGKVLLCCSGPCCNNYWTDPLLPGRCFKKVTQYLTDGGGSPPTICSDGGSCGEHQTRTVTLENGSSGTVNPTDCTLGTENGSMHVVVDHYTCVGGPFGTCVFSSSTITDITYAWGPPPSPVEDSFETCVVIGDSTLQCSNSFDPSSDYYYAYSDEVIPCPVGYCCGTNFAGGWGCYTSCEPFCIADPCNIFGGAGSSCPLTISCSDITCCSGICLLPGDNLCDCIYAFGVTQHYCECAYSGTWYSFEDLCATCPDCC